MTTTQPAAEKTEAHRELVSMIDEQGSQHPNVNACLSSSWDGHDPWGSNIAELFAIAEYVYFLTDEILEGFDPRRKLTLEEMFEDDYLAKEIHHGLTDGDFLLKELKEYYALGLEIDEKCRELQLSY